MAEQMQQAADRAQKWKGRCAKLRQDLLHNQTTAASLQAALNVSCKYLQSCPVCQQQQTACSITASITYHCLHEHTFGATYSVVHGAMSLNTLGLQRVSVWFMLCCCRCLCMKEYMQDTIS